MKNNIPVILVFLLLVSTFLILNKNKNPEEKKKELLILKEIRSDIERSIPDSVFKRKMYTGDDSDSLPSFENYPKKVVKKLDSLIYKL